MRLRIKQRRKDLPKWLDEPAIKSLVFPTTSYGISIRPRREATYRPFRMGSRSPRTQRKITTSSTTSRFTCLILGPDEAERSMYPSHPLFFSLHCKEMNYCMSVYDAISTLMMRGSNRWTASGFGSSLPASHLFFPHQFFFVLVYVAMTMS